MKLIHHIFMLLFVFTFGLSCISAATCEETETSLAKLELAKLSINNAKTHYPKCQDPADETNCTSRDKSLGHLNAALDLLSEAKAMCHTCPKPKVVVLNERPVDCTDVQALGFKKSGVYQVWPRGRGLNTKDALDVYCDMDTDGGGWTVIQRRGAFPKKVDFYQDWQTYKEGFGDIKQEFYLGNEKIFTLTNQRVYTVRFDLTDDVHEYRYASYGSFFIGDEYSGYVLHVQNHTGNATDDMKYHNGMLFSTKDRQNDRRANNDACAQKYRSAFWFAPNCGYANLNGVFQPGASQDERSIWWYNWKGYVCLSAVEVKIRRKYA